MFNIIMTPAAKFMARPKREKRLLMKWKTLGKSIYFLNVSFCDGQMCQKEQNIWKRNYLTIEIYQG